MQVNNQPNFGSIHLSNTKGKKVSDLTDIINKYATAKSYSKGSEDIAGIRGQLKGDEVSISFAKDKTVVVGQYDDFEDFLHRQIVKHFDPDAKLVKDAPEAKSDLPVIDATKW